MKVSQLKEVLHCLDSLSFELPEGGFVPAHFHLTEIGMVMKNFIDCGGKLRLEKLATLQLWYSNDTEHRLEPSKFIRIIEMAENTLGLGDVELEVEFQTSTIGKYGLDFNGDHFQLLNKQTACLASDSCGVNESKPKLQLTELAPKSNCCEPGQCC